MENKSNINTLTYCVLSIPHCVPSGDSRCNGLVGTSVINDSAAYDINTVITGVSLSGDSRRYDCDVAQLGDKTPSFKDVFTYFDSVSSGDSRQHSNKGVVKPAFDVAGVPDFKDISTYPSGDPRQDCTIKIHTL